MADLWEGHQRFAFQASLLPEYNKATDPCQGEVLHQWPWRVYHHGEFLSWPGDNYQAPSHSHLECQVADRLVRAADHYSRFWENCKIYIINLNLNYGMVAEVFPVVASLHFWGGESVDPKYVHIRWLYLLVTRAEIMGSTKSHSWWGRSCDQMIRTIYL